MVHLKLAWDLTVTENSYWEDDDYDSDNGGEHGWGLAVVAVVVAVVDDNTFAGQLDLNCPQI